MILSGGFVACGWLRPLPGRVHAGCFRRLPRHERRFQDTGRVLNGALRTLNALIAPFMTPAMS